MKIYLAGGMKGRDWRSEVRARVTDGVTNWISPGKSPDDTPEDFTRKDMDAVDLADAVFGYLEADNPYGANLALEIGYALGQGKPVVVVDEKRAKGFEMLRHCSPEHCWADFECGVADLAAVIKAHAD